jgi:hypothetical protein
VTGTTIGLGLKLATREERTKDDGIRMTAGAPEGSGGDVGST